MRSIMENAGVESGAKAIVFSLPVTDTAGIKFPVDEEDEEDVQKKDTDN